MTKGFSIYLDWLRFGAAFTVFSVHLFHRNFLGQAPAILRPHEFGGDAVIVFFVLSGFVIAESARRSAGPGGYIFDRMTRLSSVALPAMALTWALDRMGAAMLDVPHQSPPLFVYLASALAPAHQWFGLDLQVGSNAPFWSLSYEAAYYVLFAMAFWLSGARRILCLAMGALIAGPHVMLLAPAWALGVLLSYANRRVPAGRRPARFCAIVGPALYVTLLAGGGADFLIAQSKAAATGADLGYADKFLWDWAVAAIAAVHLWGMAALIGENGLRRGAGFARWAAGGSFSLYMVHWPVLIFLYIAVGHTLPETERMAVMALGALAVSILVAALFERRLRLFRRALEPLTGRKGATPPP